MPDQTTKPDGAATASAEYATVTALLDIPVDAAGRLAVSVAVAGHLTTTEALTVTASDGTVVDHHLIELDRGTRLHVLDAPEGHVTVTYEARVGLTTGAAERVSEVDAFHYRLPSRYCPSDRLEGFAATEFGTVVEDADRARSIVAWVHNRLSYQPGTTTATDDALAPLLTGQGVCRDYAHLVATLARAVGMPARYVSVYAPGLSPMDAHAVVEIAVDGAWHVFDATRLAPRASMVRIGTGRDAADVAILSGLGGASSAARFDVTATAWPGLPVEDPDALVVLG